MRPAAPVAVARGLNLTDRELGLCLLREFLRSPGGPGRKPAQGQALVHRRQPPARKVIASG